MQVFSLKVIHLVQYKIRISKMVDLQSLLKHVHPYYWGTWSLMLELFERDVNTSWTRAFDFIEKFLLGWLWLGIPSISIVC